MNEIPFGETGPEIGTPSFRFLDYLCSHMGDSFAEMGRKTPSIITRSELELFGLSSPRFAIRLYLKNGGLVHCRRIAKVIEMFGHDNSREWGNRYTNDEISPDRRNAGIEEIQEGHENVASVLMGQNCIADCLLIEPQRLCRFRFDYIDTACAKLADAYGESGGFDSVHFGKIIPYTNTMEDLGGGMCAQAASFIATAIMANHAKCVHGIAEITALAHDRNCRELALGSLEPESIARYFSRVNLRLMEQSFTQAPSEHFASLMKKRFGAIIRSYIQSGMPVLLPTSIKKLAAVPSTATSIYTKNGLKITSQALPPDENHLVVIVGYGAISFPHLPEPQQHFVFQDSATLPFLVASVDELTAIGVTHQVDPPVSDNGVIMPVVPKKVRMPLLNERVYSSDPVNPDRHITHTLHFGLDQLTRFYHFVSSYPCPAQPAIFLNRFRLVHSDDPRATLDQCETPQQRLLLECGLLRAISGLEDQHSWASPHWLWLEIFPNSVWVWNAQMPPLATLPNDPEEVVRVSGNGYLLATVRLVMETELQVTAESVEIEFFVPANPS